MSFERVRMGKDLMFTTLVEDSNGKLLEKWKVMKNDYLSNVRILIGKFGLNGKVVHVDKDKNKDKDLNWALN
jgi:hypothetical protein